jgi:glycosyltransferase involved in cell wall biosynthesis
VEKISVTHVVFLEEGPQSSPLGGAENHLLILLPALVRMGVDVELIVLLRRSGPILNEAFTRLNEAGVKISIYPVAKKRGSFSLGLNTLKRFIPLYGALKSRNHRIIHLHLDFWSFPMAARLAGCSQVVMSIHNDEQWFARFPDRQWLQWLDSGITRYIAISERVRNYYLKVVGIDSQKIDRIYYGLEMDGARADKSTLRIQYEIPADRHVTGFVGRLVYQKNVELLIEAAGFFPNEHFVIVGEGSLRDKLHRMAKDLSNVQFLGYQPNGRELISCFDLFCLPSRFEGLGLVLVEAMRHGTPILASQAGAIPEILDDGKYGFLFESENLDDLVTQLRFILENPQLVSDTTERAKEYAKVTFDAAQMAAQTARVYARVINRSETTSTDAISSHMDI